MIEMLGVLAIVGVLSAGGIAGYSMAMQSYKGSQLIERINLIATRARQLYKGNYTGISNTNLINSGKLSANDLKNPFGGDISVSLFDTGVFSVTTDSNIPAEVCVDIATTNWGGSGVFDGLFFNGGAVFEYADGSYPPTNAEVISACKGGNKEIILEFR